MSNLENNTASLEELLDLANELPNGEYAFVQPDWAQTDETQLDYIKNKPINVSAFYNDIGYVKEDEIDIGQTEPLSNADIEALLKNFS